MQLYTYCFISFLSESVKTRRGKNVPVHCPLRLHNHLFWLLFFPSKTCHIPIPIPSRDGYGDMACFSWNNSPALWARSSMGQQHLVFLLASEKADISCYEGVGMRGGNSPVFSACCISGGTSTLLTGTGWRKSSQTSQRLLPWIEPSPGMIKNEVSFWTSSAALGESQGKREPWVYMASQTPMERHVTAQMPLALTVLTWIKYIFKKVFDVCL